MRGRRAGYIGREFRRRHGLFGFAGRGPVADQISAARVRAGGLAADFEVLAVVKPVPGSLGDARRGGLVENAGGFAVDAQVDVRLMRSVRAFHRVVGSRQRGSARR